VWRFVSSLTRQAVQRFVKRLGEEKSLQARPPLLLRRLKYRTWLLSMALLLFVLSLTRLLVQNFVKALRRRRRLASLLAAAAL